MNNLGGHDLPSLLDAFHAADQRPADLLHLLHRQGLRPADGRPQGQSRRPDDAGADGRLPRRRMNVRAGHEWDKFEGLPLAGRASCRTFSTACRSPQTATRRLERAAHRGAGRRLPVTDPADDVDADRLRRACSTRSAAATATSRSRIVTTSPDVTVSTNLGPWVNRRGLFARETMADTFKSERIPSTFNWEFSPQGPAHRARHRRDEPVHPAVGARPVAFDQRRAAAADRHAVRSVHRARPRCAQLRLLPGRALHGGGDAVRHHAAPAKAARISRSPSR